MILVALLWVFDSLTFCCFLFIIMKWPRQISLKIIEFILTNLFCSVYLTHPSCQQLLLCCFCQVNLGSQYYFYMETQTALALPDEDNCLVVYSSSQCPELTQSVIAKCLGIPFHNVRVITRRVGGGFGGKAFKAIAVSISPFLPLSLWTNKFVTTKIQLHIDLLFLQHVTAMTGYLLRIKIPHSRNAYEGIYAIRYRDS